MFREELEILENQEERLDLYLLDRLDLNRSQINKYIKSGNIKVNGDIKKSGYKLKKGDKISVAYEDSTELKPEDIFFRVLYEDEDIAVISKPQDLVVHPGAGNERGTLVNGLLYKFSSLAQTPEENRPGIVHRLDKDTSGLMIIAKSQRAYEKLVDDFKNSRIHKEYLAITEGVIKEPGRIDEPIGRDPNNRIKMKVIYTNSKDAITEYTPVDSKDNLTLLRVRILTGRTHQIRVHMAYINHPVLGDTVYGHKNRYHIDKQMLHAYRLEFNHPVSNRPMTIVDDYPERFEKFFKKELIK